MSKGSAKDSGLAEYLTIAFTYFTVGVTVSVTLVDRGVDTGLTVGAALMVHSATSVLAYVAVFDAGGATIAGLLSGWLVASRFGLLAATLGARLHVGFPERVLAGYNAFDPNVAMAVREDNPDRVRSVFWRTTAMMIGGWVVGLFVGLWIGNVLGDTSRFGLDVVFPAALLGIIGGALRRRDALVAAFSAAAITLVLFPALPAGLPIVLSVVGAGVGVAYERRREVPS